MAIRLSEGVENHEALHSMETIRRLHRRSKTFCIRRARGDRQIARLDIRPASHYCRLQHHVSKFADVAGPGVALQHFNCGLRKPEIGILLTENVSGERRDVLFSISKRRNMQNKVAEPMIKVAAKAAFRYGLL